MAINFCLNSRLKINLKHVGDDLRYKRHRGFHRSAFPTGSTWRWMARSSEVRLEPRLDNICRMVIPRSSSSSVFVDMLARLMKSNTLVSPDINLNQITVTIGARQNHHTAMAETWLLATASPVCLISKRCPEFSIKHNGMWDEPR